MTIRAYGVDVVNDFLNLGLVEILGSAGIARYDVKVSQDYLSLTAQAAMATKTYSGEGLRFGYWRASQCHRQLVNSRNGTLHLNQC